MHLFQIHNDFDNCEEFNG